MFTSVRGAPTTTGTDEIVPELPFPPMSFEQIMTGDPCSTSPCTSSSQCAGTNCWSKHSRCQCNTDSQCPSGLECVEGKAAGSYKGVCEKKCSETTPSGDTCTSPCTSS